MTAATEFARFLAAPEGTRLEFKEARNRYEFDDLVRYCVALANEGGGKLVLGVTDRRPRTVAGTAAFPEVGRTEAGIFERIGRRVEIEEYIHDGERVVIVHVPARPRRPDPRRTVPSSVKDFWCSTIICGTASIGATIFRVSRTDCFAQSF